MNDRGLSHENCANAEKMDVRILWQSVPSDMFLGGLFPARNAHMDVRLFSDRFGIALSFSANRGANRIITQKRVFCGSFAAVSACGDRDGDPADPVSESQSAECCARRRFAADGDRFALCGAADRQRHPADALCTGRPRIPKQENDRA